MHYNPIGLLREDIMPCRENDVVAVRHVMQTADDPVIEHGLVSHPITVCEERISTLLIVGYHLTADLHLAHCPWK